MLKICRLWQTEVYIGVIDPAESKSGLWHSPSLSFLLILSNTWKKSENLVGQIVNHTSLHVCGWWLLNGLLKAFLTRISTSRNRGQKPSNLTCVRFSGCTNVFNATYPIYKIKTQNIPRFPVHLDEPISNVSWELLLLPIRRLFCICTSTERVHKPQEIITKSINQ